MEARSTADAPQRPRTLRRADHLVSQEVIVGGRPAVYASGGRGLPVLFLHGWGLDHRAYERSLRRLTERGCRVLAPSLPGFGGTADLPWSQRTIAGYADWVAQFLEAVGVDEPVLVLGHSFGGGVATKFAHDHAAHVRYLVLVNSVGDPRWLLANARRRIGELRWGNLVGPLITALRPGPEGLATTTMVQRMFMENAIHNPLGVLQAGLLALSADLTSEMAVLAERKLPVLVLWSDHDGVIPMSAFDTFCSTFGTDGHVVHGGHSWLLANPDVFGEVLDNVIHVQGAQHGMQVAAANTSQLRDLLASTTVPAKVANRLLDGVSPLWVLSEAPAVLAADLALCHPRLRPGEVRAVARQIAGTNTFRLTVVASDRSGLLADTAATLADEGVSIIAASATTWPEQRLALHAVTVHSTTEFDADRWATIGARLQSMATAGAPEPTFVPSERATVTRTAHGTGTTMVRVTAPDGLGLLAAVCRWFADEGVSIEAADVTTIDGIAKDEFVIDGDCDVDALEARLSGKPASPRIDPVAFVGSMLRRFRLR
ncbi:MAG: Alpha/beta hydrolase fold [Ilumatobacteraceae bacterium]|nr:Alpha/beta hydrolase fold [Ilumatobacteraceae bacterium]